MKNICHPIPIDKLEPKFYFIHTGSMLVKIMIIFGLTSVLGSLLFIYRKHKANKDGIPRNYKSYIILLTFYATVLFSIAVIVWYFFVHSSLDSKWIKPHHYVNSGGFV